MKGAEWSVPQGGAHIRLDKFLAAADRLASRRGASRALERGKVFVNGVEATAADAARRLEAGDSIRVWIDRPGSAGRKASPREVGDLSILYEDNDLIAVDKPVGVLTVPLDRQGRAADSILGQLKAYFRANRQHGPFVVHRIDRDTSGVVLFAKHSAARAGLKEQFLRRQPERMYQAVVYGHPAPASGVWRDHLVWDDRALVQRATHGRDARAKEAVSEYRTVERFRDAALLEVRLVTGKRNQIRIQAQLRGHALVGEQRYVDEADGRRPIRFPRQALHASRLVFEHPTTGRRVSIDAPLAADLRALVNRLRKGARR